jgi:hypothetical protein
MASTTFVAEPRIEAWLRSQEIAFTGPTAIRLSDIDVKTSKANQARDVALVDEAVDSYLQSLKLGDKLPALLVFKRGTKYIIIDGNNRLEAARKYGSDRVLCYVASGDLSSEAILMLTLSANATNGQPVSRAWKLRQSITLIAQGWSKEITAAHLKLPLSAIENYEKQRAADQRARRLRIVGWDDLSATMREYIARLRLDTVLVMVAETAISSQTVASTEFRAFITNVNRMHSEDEQVEAVKLWARGERESAANRRRMGRVRNMSNPKQSFSTGLGKIQAFDLNHIHTMYSSELDREVLSNKTREAIQKLVAIQYRLHDHNNVDDWLMEAMTTTRG